MKIGPLHSSYFAKEMGFQRTCEASTMSHWLSRALLSISKAYTVKIASLPSCEPPPSLPWIQNAVTAVKHWPRASCQGKPSPVEELSIFFLRLLNPNIPTHFLQKEFLSLQDETQRTLIGCSAIPPYQIAENPLLLLSIQDSKGRSCVEIVLKRLYAQEHFLLQAQEIQCLLESHLPLEEKISRCIYCDPEALKMWLLTQIWNEFCPSEAFDMQTALSYAESVPDLCKHHLQDLLNTIEKTIDCHWEKLPDFSLTSSSVESIILIREALYFEFARRLTETIDPSKGLSFLSQIKETALAKEILKALAKNRGSYIVENMNTLVQLRTLHLADWLEIYEIYFLHNWLQAWQHISCFGLDFSDINTFSRRTIDFCTAHFLYDETSFSIAMQCMQDVSIKQEVLMQCEKIDMQKTIRLFPLFQMPSSSLHTEKALLYAKTYPELFLQYIDNFSLVRDDKIESLRQCAQANGRASAAFLEHFYLDDPNIRYELARLCILSPKQDTKYPNIAYSFQNFSIIEAGKIAYLAELLARQDPSGTAMYLQNLNIDPNNQPLLIHIASICMERDAEATLENIENFQIDPDNQPSWILLAKIAIKYGLEAAIEAFPSFPIDLQHERIALASNCASRNGAATAKFFARFAIENEDAKMNIAWLCAEENAAATAEFLPNFKIQNPHFLNSLALRCAEKIRIDPKGWPSPLAQHIGHFGTLSQKTLFAVAKDCAQHENGKVEKYIQLFKLANEEERIQVALLCSQNPSNQISLYVKNFAIQDPRVLTEIAKRSIHQPDLTLRHLQKFPLGSWRQEERYEMVETYLRSSKIKFPILHALCLALPLKDYRHFAVQFLLTSPESATNLSGWIFRDRMDPDSVLPIAKLCAQYDENFPLLDVLPVRKEMLLQELLLIYTQSHTNIGFLIVYFRKFQIQDPSFRFRIAKQCALKQPAEMREHLENFTLSAPTHMHVTILCESPQAFSLIQNKSEAEKVSLIKRHILKKPTFLMQHVDTVGFASQSALCKIAILAAKRIDVLAFLKKWEIQDPETLFAIAKNDIMYRLCNPTETIRRLGIKDLQKQKELILLALDHPFDLIETFDALGIQDSHVRSSIAKISAQNSPQHIESFPFLRIPLHQNKDLAQIATLYAWNHGSAVFPKIDLCFLMLPRQTRYFLKSYALVGMVLCGTLSQEGLAFLSNTLLPDMHDRIERIEHLHSFCCLKNGTNLLSAEIDALEPYQLQLLCILCCIASSNPPSFSIQEKQLLSEILQYADEPIRRWLLGIYLIEHKETLYLPMLAVQSWKQQCSLLEQASLQKECDFLLSSFPKQLQSMTALHSWLSAARALDLAQDLPPRNKILLLFRIAQDFSSHENFQKELSCIAILCALKETSRLIVPAEETISLENLAKECLEKAANMSLEGVDNCIEKYMATLGQMRIPLLWKSYAAQWSEQEDPLKIKLSQIFFISILENTYHHDRYTRESIHRSKILGQHQDTWKRWSQSTPTMRLNIVSVQNSYTPDALAESICENLNFLSHPSSWALLKNFCSKSQSERRPFWDVYRSQAHAIVDPISQIQVEFIELILQSENTPSFVSSLHAACQKSLALLQSSPPDTPDLGLLRTFFKGLLTNLQPQSFSLNDTDHWEDFLLIPTDSKDRLRGTRGDPDLSIEILDHALDGKNRVLTLKNSKGSIVAYSFIYLLWNLSTQTPALFQDTLQGPSIFHAALRSYAKRKAQELGTPLYILDHARKTLPDTTLISFSGPFPDLFDPMILSFVKEISATTD